MGWWLLPEGSHHEIWTNGKETELVPRHREISEPLAQKILRKAQAFPAERR
jgi:mRNA interferase HicA